MKKQIPESIKDRLDRIKTAIEDTPNTVPNEMRTTFNFKGRKSPDIAEKVIQTVCNPMMLYMTLLWGQVHLCMLLWEM